jgi:hypothetical protein
MVVSDQTVYPELMVKTAQMVQVRTVMLGTVFQVHQVEVAVMADSLVMVYRLLHLC